MAAATRVFDEAPPIPYVRRERFVPRWWRRRTYLKAAAALLILVVFSGGAYVFTQRNVATDVTVNDAVSQFRHATETVQHPNAKQAEVSGPSPQAATRGRVPAHDPSPVTRRPSSAALAPTAYVLPAAGVYTYRTTGGEQISVAGAHHDYPPQTTATVTHLGGCRWQIRGDVIKEHEDLRTFCGQTSNLYQDEQARWITFYGKREGEDITFNPPQLVNNVAQQPGAKSSSHGSDPQGDGVDVVGTYLGRVPIVIGGKTVEAVRLHLTATSTGQSQGTSVDEMWLDPLTGLTLRWDRKVDSTTNSFGANVRYTETASFVHESLTPQT